MIRPAAVFLILWAVYVRAAAPNVTTGDAGELATAASVLGVAHSPGYPLFVLAGKAFTVLVRWGNEAYRVNLFSGFATASALAMMARAFPGGGWLGAAALLLAGTSPLFLKLAGATEVFGLNIFVLAAMTLSLEAAWTSSGKKWIWLGWFLFGLGLANQQTLLLVLPAWLAATWRAHVADRRVAAGGAAFLLLALGLYAFLYIRSRAQPVLDWEDPETMSRFWKVLGRARYGTLQLAQGAPPLRSWSVLGDLARFLFEKARENVTWAGLAISAAGIFTVFREPRDRRRGAWFLIAAAVSGPAFLLWANVRPSESNGEILERFLLLPAAAMLYFVVRGASPTVGNGRRGPRWAAAVAVAVWAGLRAEALAFPHRWNFIARDHGTNVLRCAPVRAYLFSDRADETEFSLAYLLGVEDRRPDLSFVDANAGVSRSVYGPDYYEIWGKPRLARREKVEGALLASTSRPFFYATLDVSQLSIPRRAAGLLFEAGRNGVFSEKTEFPYGRQLLLRERPIRAGLLGGRERHLLISMGRLIGDYSLGLGASKEGELFYRLADIAGADPWRIHLASWHQRNGRGEEAERLYREQIGRAGAWPLAWSNLGVLFSERRRWREALSCYDKAVEADPAYAEAYYNRGVAHWNLGNWASVARDFEKTLQLNPGHPSAAKFLDQARRRGKT